MVAMAVVGVIVAVPVAVRVGVIVCDCAHEVISFLP